MQNYPPDPNLYPMFPDVENSNPAAPVLAWTPPAPDATQWHSRQTNEQISGTIGGGNPQFGGPVQRSSAGSNQSAKYPGSNLFENPVTNMALKGINSQLQDQIKAYGGWFSFNRIKPYFAVDNQYVLRKLKILLFPLMQSDWKRQPTESFDNTQADKVKLPKHDVHAPDLYIPMMAFITLILLLGFVHGASGNFTPEYLGVCASSTLVLLAFEVAFIKGGFYVLGDAETPGWMDLVALSSYKYVGLIVDVLFSLVVGRGLLLLIITIFSCFSAILVIRSLKRALSRTIGNQADFQHPSSSRRDTFLLVLGACQILICFILIRSVIFASSSAASVASFTSAGPTGVTLET